jgi:hypothetical protein
MGKITVFTGCSSDGEKVKDLLKQKGADFKEVSVAAKPEWRHYMYLLANGEHVAILFHAQFPLLVISASCPYMYYVLFFFVRVLVQRTTHLFHS